VLSAIQERIRDLGPNLHGLLIGIYIFYENWSTETFRKKESKRGLLVTPQVIAGYYVNESKIMS
jgi:hypothetical protein